MKAPKRTRFGPLPYVIAFLIALTLLRGPCRLARRTVRPVGRQTLPASVQVAEVVDGDTIRTAGGRVIRLVGIDAPERHRPLYREARSFLRSLLKGRKVRLRYELETRDRHGRTLAHVLVPTPRGEVNAGQELLRRGLAELYPMPPNVEFFERFKKAQAEAVLAGCGLWTLPVKREEFYVAGRWRFHRPSCPHTRDIPRPEIAKDRTQLLLAGKARCRRCRP